MHWIKRIVFLIVGLIALVAISLFAYKSYRASKAADIRIPKESIAIAKLYVDELIWDMFRNSIANYDAYYGASTDTAGKARPKVWNSGMDIPAVLYGFQLPDTAKRFYAVLDITNRAKAVRFIQEQLQLGLDSAAGLDNMYSTRNLKLLLGEKNAVIMVGQGLNLVQMQALATADQQDWILGKEFFKMDSPDSDLILTDRSNNWAAINFENGKISVKGEYRADYLRYPRNPKINKNALKDPEVVLQMDVNLDFGLLLKHHEEAIKKLDLPIDSVENFVGSYAALQVRSGSVAQRDTVITYTYDDNFEMTEQQEIQETLVPNIQFQVQASPHLMGYLPEKLFYTFHKWQGQEMIHMATAKEERSTPTFEPSASSIQLTYHKKPDMGAVLGWIPKYDLIESMDVKGVANSDNKLQITGDISLIDAKINSFYQIFK